MITTRKELEPLKGTAIVSEALRYARGFFTTYPRRISLILFLMVLQTLSAGIGILFILPLLSVLGLAGEAASNHGITRALSQVLSELGIPLSLLPMLVLYVLLVTFVASLRSFTMIVSTKVQQQYTHKLRSDMYQLVMRARWRELSTYTLADLGYLLSGQMSQVGRLSQLVLQFTSQVILAFGFFVVALLVSWQMSLVALTFVAVSSVLLLPLYRRVLGSGSTQLRANQRLFKAVTEHLHSLRMIKLFGAESQFASALMNTSKSLERQQVRLTEMNAITTWMLTVMAVLLVSSFFYVSIVFVGSELAELIVLVVILARLLPLLSSLQKTVQQALHSLPASAGANEMARKLVQVQEPRVAFGQKADLHQSLALSAVSFRYPDTSDAVLTNFSCSIPANQVVAITGPSGAGKSTVADLLAGLQLPDAGELLLDGKALHDDALMSWRHSVAYVVQEPLLFNDTIRNNLRWVREKVTEADMEKALRDAAAWDFVSSLPKGLDTLVGDHGRQLSGGQRQRIAIARALLREPQLLILDEATNALDQANEALVKETIVNLRGKLTVVVISHQASINDLADHVIDLGEQE